MEIAKWIFKLSFYIGGAIAVFLFVVLLIVTLASMVMDIVSEWF